MDDENFFKSFYELQEELEEYELPPFPSLFLLMGDDSKQTFNEKVKKYYCNVMKAILFDNQNASAILDFVNCSAPCDLGSIEKLLEKQQAVSENLNEVSKSSVQYSAQNDFVSAKDGAPKRLQQVNSDDNLPLKKRCNIDDQLIEKINNEIIDMKSDLSWNDIAGLSLVKKSINEIVVWPMLRPDIFVGIRSPPKGILLFGPPGTGKTMIGKCIANQCKATFFSISASSLTSKWVGEGEKMVRALFYVARDKQPSVIFVDEIDSLLSQRSDNENEASRKIKTEFLVQFDGVGTHDNDRILIIGATNRPHEIDEAARRRLVKRIYVPLPDSEARLAIIRNLIKDYTSVLEDGDFTKLSALTDGYSGSDLYNLCREAAMEPLREISDITMANPIMRPLSMGDFSLALRQIRKSVGKEDLAGYLKWNDEYGSGH